MICILVECVQETCQFLWLLRLFLFWFWFWSSHCHAEAHYLVFGGLHHNFFGLLFCSLVVLLIIILFPSLLLDLKLHHGLLLHCLLRRYLLLFILSHCPIQNALIRQPVALSMRNICSIGWHARTQQEQSNKGKYLFFHD